MRFRLLPLAVVIALLVAACGGSSTPTTTSKKHSHKASSAHANKPKRTYTYTTAATNTGAASTSSVSTTSHVTFASVSHCANLTGIGEQYAKAMQAAVSGGKYNLAAVVKAYQDLANAAPSAIRPDIRVIGSAFTAYASAVSRANYKFGSVPSATQIAALDQAAHVFSQSKLQAASKAIAAWAGKNCSVG